jgi:phosphoglycolate phosphatase
MRDILGIIFDKDGTLFDFTRTWGEWTRRLILALAGDDADLAGRLALRAGYDPVGNQFAPDSMIIAQTTEQIAAALLPLLPGRSHDELQDQMNRLSAETVPVPAVDLPGVLAALRDPAPGRARRIGLATNDAERPAREHLRSAGVEQMFDFVAGYDSGFGGKPLPGQLLAFAQRMGLDPARVAMVGDSLHDLDAGRDAGMTTVAVLTGIARREDLAPHADVVLPDIGHLPAWLAGQAAD